MERRQRARVDAEFVSDGPRYTEEFRVSPCADAEMALPGDFAGRLA